MVSLIHGILKREKKGPFHRTVVASGWGEGKMGR